MSRRLPSWSLGWLVPTVILLSRPAGAAGACAIVETASGDRTMAESIASLLEQHGVSTRVERCGSNRAHVLIDESADSASITVSIRDGEDKEARRRIERNEKTAAVAASLVESFVLGEDTDLLLRPSPPAHEDRTGRTAASPRRLGQASLLGGFLFGSDSSTWYGVQLDGCARLAWSCIGARARLAYDDNGGGISSDLVRAQWGGSVLWSVPFDGQRWQFLPALALGVTYTESSLFPAPFRVSASDYDLRGQLSFGLAAFLTASWAVRLDLAGELGIALSHSSRQQGDSVSALLGSFVPEPPGQSAWLALGLEYRR
jgi:hypothetical protein